MTTTPHGEPSQPDEIATRSWPELGGKTGPAFGGEPAAVIGTIVAVLAAVQQLALPLPAAINAAITVILVIAGALGIRQVVTPA